ncbi:MAG: DUF4097 domain-containing protein [Treponema sp.]|nr:DUF4097 domain-containing protein [Treponema sp.]
MKRSVLISLFILAVIVSASCGGSIAGEPVNVQEIRLENIDSILIRYNSERITLLNNDSNSIIIKEYMNINKKDYYAKIANSGKDLVIEAGQRPIGINNFKAHIEVYIPVSNKNFTIRSSSGDITGEKEYTAASMNFGSSSGDISINSVTANTINFTASSGVIKCERANGNTSIETSSGNIIVGAVTGNVNASSSSGRIEIKQISGELTANTASGSIRCENIEKNASVESNSGNVFLGVLNGNVTVKTSSGSVVLAVPANLSFNFLSKTSSGRLRTPFSDKLSSPFTDRDSFQGVINEDRGIPASNLKNVNIRTSSGSITVNWI